MDKVWAGIDAGKGFHWAHVLDASGTRLLSGRVENEEADLIDRVLSLAGRSHVVWAIDQPGGDAALLLALLWARESFTLLASPWTVPAMPTAESPKPTPEMPASLPTPGSYALRPR